MTRLSREEQTKEARPPRIPVSEANRNRLFVAGLDHDNFAYRWVNDTEGRIAAFQAGYWELVDKNGEPVGDGGVDNSAGTSSKFSKGVGRSVTAYLMRIPKEYWLQDQEKKELDIKEKEQANIRAAKQAADYGSVTFKTGQARPVE